MTVSPRTIKNHDVRTVSTQWSLVKGRWLQEVTGGVQKRTKYFQSLTESRLVDPPASAPWVLEFRKGIRKYMLRDLGLQSWRTDDPGPVFWADLLWLCSMTVLLKFYLINPLPPFWEGFHAVQVGLSTLGSYDSSASAWGQLGLQAAELANR